MLGGWMVHTLFLRYYNNNISIIENEMCWIGDNNIATWGHTNENNGTNKDQPRYFNVSYNLFYGFEIL